MLGPHAQDVLAENSRVKQDTVMGVVFSGMFGLGIVLYVSIETSPMPSVNVPPAVCGLPCWPPISRATGLNTPG